MEKTFRPGNWGTEERKLRQMKNVFKNLSEQADAHQENVSGMKAVWNRFHEQCKKIGKKIGATGYSGNPAASSWVTFIMSNLETKFGSINGENFEESAAYKNFFKVPDQETPENISNYFPV